MSASGITHSCVSPLGIKFRVNVVPLSESGPSGERYETQVLTSSDQGTSWQMMPMKLRVRFKLQGLVATWPPESVDLLTMEGEVVVIEYRDRWVPFEKSIMPFGWDRESIWRARYSAKSQTWSLERIRHLDYDSGADKPIYD